MEILLPGRLSSFDYMLIAFNLVRPIDTDVSTLHAAPRITPQQSRSALRWITVNRLSHTAVFTRRDEIPPERLTDA